MFRAYLTSFPWDLLDGDVGARFDRLHGEIGVSGVSVALATGPVTQLRRPPAASRVVMTRGGLFFHPEEQRYTGTRIKPIVSSWTKGKHPVSRIARACLERGMELRVTVSAALTGRYAAKYPDMAAKNSFGVSSRAGLCLSNPDVQSYLAALVGELSASDGVSAVVLTDFFTAWPEAFDADLLGASHLSDAHRSLLATCFCESCHQLATAAGVDVSSAKEAAGARLQHALDGESDRTGATTSSPLADYDRWRSDQLGLLLSRLRNECHGELLLDRPATGPVAEQIGGVEAASIAGVIVRVEQPAEVVSARHASALRHELRFSPAMALPPHGAQLVSGVCDAVERGVQSVTFDQLGLLPESALAPIKQAIRFARRTTTE